MSDDTTPASPTPPPAATAPDSPATSTTRFPLAAVSWTVRIVLPVVLILGAWILVRIIIANQPQASREQPPRLVAQVEVERLQTQSFTVQLPTRGTVQAETSSDLVAQVSGVITQVSPAFTDGGTFKAGEELVRIDPRDYDVAVARAKAEISQASIAVQQAQIAAERIAIEVSQYDTSVQVARAAVVSAERELEEETARSQQAEAEWKGLNGERPAPDLVLRKPQLASAQAGLESARAQLAQRIADQGLAKPRLAAAQADVAAREAALEAARTALRQAELDLERTVIRAPYDGRVETRAAHVGQYVNSGRTLAGIYSTASAEIHLPLTNRQLAFVQVPNGHTPDGPAAEPAVRIAANFGDRSYQWQGRIVRSQGVMDAATRQLYVVARVDAPYAPREPGQPPLRVGMFVTAEVEGEALDDVFVIPRQAVRGDNELYIVDEARMELTRRKVRPIWSDDDVIVVRDDIAPGELICVSPVAFLGQRLPVQARWAATGEPLTPPDTQATDANPDARAPAPDDSSVGQADATRPGMTEPPKEANP